MSKLAVLILTLFITHLLYGQVSETSTVTKTDIIKFFSDIRQSQLSTAQILLVNKPVKLELKDILFYTEHNKVIVQSLDTGFINEQIKAYENYQWDTTLIERTQIVDKNILDSIFKNSNKENCWKTFKKLYGKEEFFSISLPIFITDKKYCFVEINRYCGSICGSYCVILFRLEGNLWKFFKELECSLS